MLQPKPIRIAVCCGVIIVVGTYYFDHRTVSDDTVPRWNSPPLTKIAFHQEDRY